MSELTYVKCDVAFGTIASEFDPFPGSNKAIRVGCICPIQHLWPNQLLFALDCPVHELERATAH